MSYIVLYSPSLQRIVQSDAGVIVSCAEIYVNGQ